MLAWTIYLSFLGAAAMMFLPEKRREWPRRLALACSVAGLLCVAGAIAMGANGNLQTIVRVPWIPRLGIDYHLGADGISLAMVLLTGIAGIAGVLFSWDTAQRPREFFALYLALIGGVYGVFLSLDLFLLFVFYEIAIIPKYFLIAIWGSTRREYGAMQLALYSFVGSAMVLIGILAAYSATGGVTTNLLDLARGTIPDALQMWAFPLVFAGFGILAGLWPLHTWAPTGHVAAPTAASMLLAGVVMKLGAYGCLRVAMTLFPHGMEAWPQAVLGFHSWRGVFGLLGAVGIVYGALVALVQKDFKFVIGYSSVSHMGFVMVGLMALNAVGIRGAVLQMFSHGIIAGLLFAVVGRMVYDRTHTRELEALGGMALGRELPFAAVIFGAAAFASMGLPGFSGFPAEVQVLAGAWQRSPSWAILAGVGIVLGAAYTLRALQKTFFSDPRAPESDIPALPPITRAEKAGGTLLLAATLVVGLYPNWLLNWTSLALNSELFQWLDRGIWR